MPPLPLLVSKGEVESAVGFFLSISDVSLFFSLPPPSISLVVGSMTCSSHLSRLHTRGGGMVLPLPRGEGGGWRELRAGLWAPDGYGGKSTCVYSYSCPAVACSCFTCLWCDTRGEALLLAARNYKP